MKTIAKNRLSLIVFPLALVSCLLLIAFAGCLRFLTPPIPGPRPESPSVEDNPWYHADPNNVPDGACASDPGRVGDPAPNFTRSDQLGYHVELCQFYGKRILLHFYSANYNNQGREELDALNEFYNLHHDNLQIIAIMAEGPGGFNPAPADVHIYRVDPEVPNNPEDPLSNSVYPFPILADKHYDVTMKYFHRHLNGSEHFVVIIDEEMKTVLDAMHDILDHRWDPRCRVWDLALTD